MHVTSSRTSNLPRRVNLVMNGLGIIVLAWLVWLSIPCAWLPAKECHSLSWPGGIWLFFPPIMLLCATWLAKRKGPQSTATRSFFLLASSFFLLSVFAAPPIKPIEALRQYSDNPLTLDGQQREILKDEMKKANDEISMRLEEEDRWFNYKFLLVGGLLGAFLTHLVFGRSPRAIAGRRIRGGPEGRLDELFNSNATCTALALACMVAITIDGHVRNSVTTMNQLGTWLAYYAEPTFLHQPFQSGTSGFLLWEHFLRLDVSGKDLAGGMHADDLYSFSYWPQLHSLTWLLYILYLGIFQTLSLKAKARQRGIMIASFALVHVLLLSFAWTSHVTPSTFACKPIPYYDWWISGWGPPLLYLIPLLLLISCAVPYLEKLSRPMEVPGLAKPAVVTG